MKLTDEQIFMIAEHDRAQARLRLPRDPRWPNRDMYGPWNWEFNQECKRWRPKFDMGDWGPAAAMVEGQPSMIPDYDVYARGLIVGPKGLVVPHVANGYEKVSLRHGNGSVSVGIHRLVCWTFHGPPPFDRALVRHLNGEPCDNRRENLCWGNEIDNARDRMRHEFERKQAAEWHTLRESVLEGSLDTLLGNKVLAKLQKDEVDGHILCFSQADRIGCVLAHRKELLSDVISVIVPGSHVVPRKIFEIFGFDGCHDDDPLPSKPAKWIDRGFSLNVTKWEFMQLSFWIAELCTSMLQHGTCSYPFGVADGWSLDAHRLGIREHWQQINAKSPEDVMARLTKPGIEVSVRLR